MIKKNALIGGEESGGFGFRDHIPERDGVLASLYILDLIARTKKSITQLLADLYDLVGPHYYARKDMQISNEIKCLIVELISSNPPKTIGGTMVVRFDTNDGLKFSLADGSWLMIRLSGTEPLLRIYAESSNPGQVELLINEGCRLIKITG